MLAILGNTTERILIQRSLHVPGMFAHLNVLFIRSFDYMVLRSYHTQSRYGISPDCKAGRDT